MKRHVVVGAGLAGHRAALALRNIAKEDNIVLIGNEAHMPYERPPLSKEFLLSADDNNVFLAGKQDYDNNGVNYISETFVESISRGEGRVYASNGDSYSYDTLLLATGSRPRLLSGFEPSPRIGYLRTLEDAIRLKAVLSSGPKRITIIGGGFIGLEAASVAARLGHGVTIIEAGDRILERSMPYYVSSYLQDLHEKNSVDFLIGQTPICAERARSRIVVKCTTATVECDFVLVGVGVLPNVELAVAAELEVRNGIIVDRGCRTSDESIFAAGEVTAHPTYPDGIISRVESWRVASEQPVVAARNMAGIAASWDELPWLWSDQYGLNLQSIGHPTRGDTYFMNGGAGSDSWTLIATDEKGAVQGAVAVNRGRDISLIKRLVARGARTISEIFPDAHPFDRRRSV